MHILLVVHTTHVCRYKITNILHYKVIPKEFVNLSLITINGHTYVEWNIFRNISLAVTKISYL